MAEETKEARPKRRVKWGLLTGGIALAGPALVCVGFDVYNNILFGLQRNEVIAGILATVGILLAVLPCLMKGNRDPLWLVVAICAGISIFAGLQNHREAQRNHAYRVQGETRAYEQAQAAIIQAQSDLASAQSERDSIKETTGSAELKLALEAARKLYDDNKDVCGTICKAAQKQMQTLPDRIGNAKAKEDAEARAIEAQNRLRDAKDKSPAQAKASVTGETEEFWLGVGLVLFTVSCAPFFHRGWHDVTNAFTYEPVKTVRGPYKAKAIASPADAPQMPEKALKGYPGFLAQCQPSDEPVAAKDVMVAAERWWMATKQTGKLSARGLGLELAKAGYTKHVDRQKRVTWAVKLPDTAPKLVAVAS
jgi:hypothetical protein